MTESPDVAAAGIFRELHAAVLPVTDMARSRKFYEETLGLRPRKVGAEGILVVYGTGGPTNVCLYVADAVGDPVPPVIGGAFPSWRTDDIEATHALLDGRGVECSPISAGDALMFFVFRDPDGNRHDVCQYGPGWLE